jgi:hypothetical protein
MQAALASAFAPFATAFFRAGRPAVALPQGTPAAAPVRALKAGTTLVLPAPQGHRIDCVRGSLWLTHDGDPKDIVLAPGDRYIADRNTRLVVYGLEASELRVA